MAEMSINEINELINLIQINALLNDINNNNTLKHCLTAIVNKYGGIKCFLIFFMNMIRYETNTTFNSITTIIKDEIFKQTIDKSSLISKQCTIQSLPNDCKNYMMAYLEKKDIKSFGITSRKNCIIYLKQMNRFRDKHIEEDDYGIVGVNQEEDRNFCEERKIEEIPYVESWQTDPKIFKHEQLKFGRNGETNPTKIITMLNIQNHHIEIFNTWAEKWEWGYQTVTFNELQSNLRMLMFFIKNMFCPGCADTADEMQLCKECELWHCIFCYPSMNTETDEFNVLCDSCKSDKG